MSKAEQSTANEEGGAEFGNDQIVEFRRALLNWYDRHRRDLPWRDIDDPYRTWVAEVMLQQTQVATVVDYFERWMERFPDVESVAEAETEEILELWQGLGYYRRARFLHRSARKVVEEYGGELPGTADELEELTGIGPYTAGAIASIAFEQPTPVVDGNVERVLSRLRAIEGDPKATANQKVYWRLAGELVDRDRPGDFNQGMMELGATICTPQNPSCLICPVRQWCEGFAEGDPEQFPAPAKRTRQKPMAVATAVLTRPGQREGQAEYLVLKRPADGLLGGLWEFPSVELGEAAESEEATEGLEAYLQETLGLQEAHRRAGGRLGEVTHLFSHIRMTIHVYRREVDGAFRPAEERIERPAQWVERSRLEEVAMSAAMRRVQALEAGT